MAKTLSLWQTLAKVRDPRSALGRRHPLPAILSLSVVAMLSGARSLFAIAQFGKDHGEPFAVALGFGKGKTPCCATLHDLFKAMDAKPFEKAIGRWIAGRRETAGWEAASIDGKS